ncbi:MAG: phosphoribosyltransferase, partial [Actinomycetota bacterium]|nr:phosphoribosyltransferase [Actinomycetota bacterium]MEC8982512.1 phosphoribosyltransferase [Actinomycetota bacterium]
MNWDRYGTAVRELAQMVADDGYRPDMILSIARGGLFVAGSLGYALAVKNLYVMNVEYYTGVDERLDIP